MSVKGYLSSNGVVPAAQLIAANVVRTAEGAILKDNGQKNYVRSAQDATGWLVSGAGVTVGTTTTAANLPSASIGSAIAVTRVSGTTAYAYTRFTLDTVDLNKKLQVMWDHSYAGTSGDYTLQLFSNTLANYTGTSTQLTLPVTAIPAGTTTFNTTFDSPSSAAPYLELRIIAAAGTTPLYMNNVTVTPGLLTQGAAISSAQTWSPTISAGFGTVSSFPQPFTYWRIGSRLVGIGAFQAGTPAASLASFTLPAGLTSATPSSSVFPVGKWYSELASANNPKNGDLMIDSGTSRSTIYFGISDYVPAINSYTKQNANQFCTTGNQISVSFDIEINEWAGNGAVNLGAGAQVEYASSTNGTWNSNATAANTVAGPAGSPISGALGGSRTKVVQWQYPIQQDDTITLQYLSIGGQWMDQDVSEYPFLAGASVSAGAKLDRTVTGSTTTTVIFNQYGQLATFNSVTGASNWDSTVMTAWRLRKSKASAPVGFGLAGLGTSGLVSQESTASVALDNSFTSGSATFYKVGKVVTMTVSATAFTSSSNPQTIATVPAAYRPAATASALVDFSSGLIYQVYILSTGQIGLFFRNYSGAATAMTATANNYSVSYVVP